MYVPHAVMLRVFVQGSLSLTFDIGTINGIYMPVHEKAAILLRI